MALHESLAMAPRVLFRMLLHVLCVRLVAGNTSLLEPAVPRRSTLRLSSGLFPAIVHGGSSSPPGLAPEGIPCRCSARVCSPPACLPLLRPPGCSPAKAIAAVAAAAVCLVVSERALLDANMLELIDRSACLVGACCCFLCSFRACTVTRNTDVQRRVRSLLVNFFVREALWKVFCSQRAHSELLLWLHCDSCSFCVHVVKRCVTLFCDVLLHVLHLGSHPALEFNVFATFSAVQSVCALSMACALSLL